MNEIVTKMTFDEHWIHAAVKNTKNKQPSENDDDDDEEEEEEKNAVCRQWCAKMVMM